MSISRALEVAVELAFVGFGVAILYVWVAITVAFVAASNG